MFLKNNKYKDLVIAILVTLAIAYLGYRILENLGVVTNILGKIISLSTSFFYGIIIAYALNPSVKFFQNRLKFNRSLSIVVTYAIFITILVLVFVYGIPSLVDSIKGVISDIPKVVKETQQYADSLLKNPHIKDVLNFVGADWSFDSYLTKVENGVVTFLGGSFTTIVSFSSHLIKYILGLLISIYVLIDKDRLIKGTKRVMFLVFKEKNTPKILQLGRIYHNMIGTYVGIKAIDSAIIGGMAFIILTIVKSDYALLLALIVGVTNMIPYFGPLVGEVIGFLFNVFVSPTKGLIVFLALFALQMFDGWFLDPKLIGGKVGVRPFWIIYAVVIGGGFFGPIGMLLASPTAATINIYISKVLERNREKLKHIDKI